MSEINCLDGVGAETIKYVDTHLKTLWPLAALPIIVDTLIMTVFGAGGGAFALIALLLSFFLYPIFAIAIHRHVLLEQRSIFPPLDNRVFVFAGMVIVEGVIAQLAVAAVVFVPIMLAAFGGFGSRIALYGVVVFVVLAATVAAAGVTARFIAVFPHVAITPPNKRSLSAAFALTEGYVIPIMLRLMVFGIGAALIITGIWMIPLVSTELELITGFQRVLYAPIQLIQSAITYIALGFFVVLASLIYRRLVADLEQQIATDPIVGAED